MTSSSNGHSVPDLPNAAVPGERWWYVLLLVLGLVLRAWGLQESSLSMDEWYEVNLAGKTVTEIIGTGDGFPPLYHLLLHFWIGFWGESSARWLSVLFGMGTIVVLGGTARQLGGSRVRLAVTALAAVLPLHVWFSQESRCYSLLLLLTACAFRCCWSLIARPGARGYAGLAATFLAGLYTHYFFGFVVLACGLCLLWRLGGRLRAGGWWWGLGCAMALVPLFFLLRADLETQLGWSHKQHFGVAACGYTYFTVISGFTLGPSLEELHSLATRDAVWQFLPWIVGCGVGLVGVVAEVVRQTREARPNPKPLSRTRDGLMLAMLSSGPIVVGIACNVLDVGYQVRYSLWATIPMVLGLGWSGLLAWRRRPGRLGVVILVVLCFAALVQRHRDDRYANPDVRSAAKSIPVEDHRPIVVVSAYMVPVFESYLPDHSHRIARLPNQHDRSKSLEAWQQVVDEAVPDGTDFWLVLCREYHDDPTGELVAWLREHSQLEEERTFIGLRLIRLRRVDGGRRSAAIGDVDG